ncbi:TIGR02281 family clan AA aspartic protease [Pseudomonas sp. gcc21]|uniref:retropepsin-like aspartic protease family protein n=1 Tax=Pseudomonas sp. gcc21 TaxID=2726989 RepID=UPI0014513CCE|nr:TIGR02281 family clan AA aspartic protease [Pseudomonas sp. gcc21]QJD60170.1 TIGR02281 family clan AA aspartic protease [Pseudomonas sp. gcc21]
MNIPHRCALFLALLLIAAPTSAEPVVRVVGLFSGAAVITIDGQRHMLRVGKPGPQGIELLSADSDSARLAINGKPREFRLQKDFSQSSAQPDKQRVVVPRGQGGHFRIQGSINGHGVPFLIDTGATSVAMNSAHARRLGIDYKLAGTRVGVTTASGIANGYRVQLERIKAGEIELYNIEGMVIEGSYPTEVLLGMTFLSRLRLVDEGNILVMERRY